MNLTDLKFHELSNLFPLMDEDSDELRRLAEDIKANGLLEPIVVLDGLVLDGRNRYRACQLAGVRLTEDHVIQFEEYFPDTDPFQFVMAKNLQRRQLTTSQRAALGEEVFKWLAVHLLSPRENGASSIEDVGKEIDQRYGLAASLTQVSAKSVERAVSVLNADPGLHKEVRAGKTNLHQATEAVKQRKKEAKASLMDKDEAQQRILEICGEKFWSAMMAKRMAGLKTGAERVALADRPNAELKVLSAIMFWGELTLSEALEFKKQRFGKAVTKKWKLEDLMAVMGTEAEYQESFVTTDREFSYKVTIERFTPKARTKSSE